MANLFNFKIEYTLNLDKIKFYYFSYLLGLFIILYCAVFQNLLHKTSSLFYGVIHLIPHSIAGGIGRNHFISLGTIVRLVPLSIACGISGDEFISLSTVVCLIPLPIPRGIGRYYFLNGKTSG